MSCFLLQSRQHVSWRRVGCWVTLMVDPPAALVVHTGRRSDLPTVLDELNWLAELARGQMIRFSDVRWKKAPPVSSHATVLCDPELI